MQQLGEGAYALQSVFLLGIYQQWYEGCQESLDVYKRQIEREEKEETFFGVSSSCRPFFPAT